MTRFKIFSAAVLVSGLIATPVLAQQAVQEPGLQSFYNSLGVGSGYGGPENALASAGRVDLSAPAPRAHHVRGTVRRHAGTARP